MRSKGRGLNRHRTSFYRTAVIVAAALLAAAFLSGTQACGIQSYPYLAPVKDEDITLPLTGEADFSFVNNTDNDATYFYGYEIYYKFYSTDAGSSSFDTEEPSLINGVSLSQATNTYGFRRLVENTDAVSKPLIDVLTGNRNTPFTVTIDFSNASTPGNFPTISYNAETKEAARYVLATGNTTENYYSFSPSELTDVYSDITTEMLAGFGTIRLALIVFTYGKYNVYQDLYSAEAAYLGSITLNTS